MSGCGALLGALLLASPGGALPPDLTLKPGEMFFRVDGKPTFVFGRNPTGWKVSQFAPLFREASRRGDLIARIHLDNGMVPAAAAGEVDERWAENWDQVLDMAAERHIHVLPVFTAWAFWSEKGAGERPSLSL